MTSLFTSIFDHVATKHIDYEKSSYLDIDDGIHIETDSSNTSVGKLSKELA